MCVLISQVYKQLVRKRYDEYIFSAQPDARGHIPAPSRQLVSNWCVEAWDEIDPKLVIKSFLATGITTPDMYDDETLARVDVDEPILIPEFRDDDEAHYMPDSEDEVAQDVSEEDEAGT